MTLKINTFYPGHASAVPKLYQKGIELNVINNKSPYVLTAGDPNVVIHPLSKVIQGGEFPQIKFCGPKCEFPNYDFTYEQGFDDSDIIKYIHPNPDKKGVFINTTNDIAFIKYLESLDENLEIYGKKCDSLYYKGPLEHDSYYYYYRGTYLYADNEHDALKALRAGSMSTVLTNFNFVGCINFKTRTTNDKKFTKNEIEDFLEDRNWSNIFRKLLRKIGENYE